jgi:hypothetical protein
MEGSNLGINNREEGFYILYLVLGHFLYKKFDDKYKWVI